jgi:hypothetical protein
MERATCTRCTFGKWRNPLPIAKSRRELSSRILPIAIAWHNAELHESGLSRIELVDKPGVVNGAQIMKIPRFHGADMTHCRIFADIEIVDVLDRAG